MEDKETNRDYQVSMELSQGRALRWSLVLAVLDLSGFATTVLVG
jgi:hypothetical protein